jgi:hypothetical protein
MQINIYVSSSKLFQTYYPELYSKTDVNIFENKTVFGLSDILYISLLFVFESSISGFTWDYIKEQIFPYINNLLVRKRKNDAIKVTLKFNKEEYDIEIPEGYNIADIEIPQKLKVHLEK